MRRLFQAREMFPASPPQVESPIPASPLQVESPIPLSSSSEISPHYSAGTSLSKAVESLVNLVKTAMELQKMKEHTDAAQTYAVIEISLREIQRIIALEKEACLLEEQHDIAHKKNRS